MIALGTLNIDKPAGSTSHDVVAQIRSLLRQIGIKRVGHTGTLDPMATGVLPICFGQATKISAYLMEGEKEYEATLRLGQETNTQDASGVILRSCVPPPFSPAVVSETLSSFVGTILQTPPIYSAIKKGGVPLYRFARQGLSVERAPRWVTIRSIRLNGMEGNDLFLNVVCGKGTYIRTLCADIGEKLKVYGCLSSLRRIRSGPFSIERAIPLDTFIKAYHAGRWENHLFPSQEVIRFLENSVVPQEALEKITRVFG